MRTREFIPVAISGTVLELTGILTVLTNEGSYTPDLGLGFSVPTVLPPDTQGIGLLIAGGLIIAGGVILLEK